MPLVGSTRIGSDGQLTYSASTTPTTAQVSTTAAAVANITVSADNIGSGIGIYEYSTSSPTGVTLNFNTLKSANGIILGIDGNSIVIQNAPNYVENIVTNSLATFVLTGNGVPSNSLGVNGQIYIDTLTPAFYPPKSNGAWPSPISFGGGSVIPVIIGTDYSVAGNYNFVQML